MKLIKKFLMDFLAQSERDWESMKRGTYAGWIPLAIMAGAKIAQAIASKKSGDAAGKEQKRAAEANEQAKFESALAHEGNVEDDRINRMTGIGNQLTGARALDPALLQSFLKRRAVTTRKGAVADPTKGSGWALAGDLFGQAGGLANAYMQGLNGGEGPSTGGEGPSTGGAAPTTLLPNTEGMPSPISMGGQSFDFSPRKDLK